MSEFFFSVILILIVWYVVDSIHTKEVAVTHCKKLCARNDYRLLDETVEKFSTKLIRDQSGFIKFFRIYTFQYSLDDLQRHRGKITMLGKSVLQIEFEHEDYFLTLNA